LLNNGYIIEAQEIETLKLISTVGDDVRAELTKYKELLEREPVNVLCSSKNIESMRASIISSSIKDCVRPKCMHCKLPMVKVKRTYRKIVISMNQFDVKSF
jgi:DNA-directed RNA polymerase I subunit RPA1